MSSQCRHASQGRAKLIHSPIQTRACLEESEQTSRGGQRQNRESGEHTQRNSCNRVQM